MTIPSLAFCRSKDVTCGGSDQRKTFQPIGVLVEIPTPNQNGDLQEFSRNFLARLKMHSQGNSKRFATDQTSGERS